MISLLAVLLSVPGILNSSLSCPVDHGSRTTPRMTVANQARATLRLWERTYLEIEPTLMKKAHLSYTDGMRHQNDCCASVAHVTCHIYLTYVRKSIVCYGMWESDSKSRLSCP